MRRMTARRTTEMSRARRRRVLETESTLMKALRGTVIKIQVPVTSQMGMEMLREWVVTLIAAVNRVEVTLMAEMMTGWLIV